MYGWGYIRWIGVYDNKPFMEFKFDNSSVLQAVFFNINDKNMSWKLKVCTLAFLWQQKIHVNREATFLANVQYPYDYSNR